MSGTDRGPTAFGFSQNNDLPLHLPLIFFDSAISELLEAFHKWLNGPARGTGDPFEPMAF